jgi:hypothetical protein
MSLLQGRREGLLFMSEVPLQCPSSPHRCRANMAHKTVKARFWPWLSQKKRWKASKLSFALHGSGLGGRIHCGDQVLEGSALGALVP